MFELAWLKETRPPWKDGIMPMVVMRVRGGAVTAAQIYCHNTDYSTVVPGSAKPRRNWDRANTPGPKRLGCPE